MMRVARERCLRLPAVLYAGSWLAGSFLLNVYSTYRCDPEPPHPRGRALINHDLLSSRLHTSIPPGYLCILTATTVLLYNGRTTCGHAGRNQRSTRGRYVTQGGHMGSVLRSGATVQPYYHHALDADSRVRATRG